jgi:Mg2+/Co2+ transporter CorB
MDLETTPTSSLLAGIGILLVLSAYFSGSETAMMSLNRYRLRHLADAGHGGARRASALLARPDRLLSVILFGNNMVNNLAAALSTVICIRLFGDSGVAIGAVVVTLVFLVCSEIAPKTLAAHHPEPIAFASSFALLPLQRLLYPFVALLNGASRFVLRPMLKTAPADADHLSPDELRTLLRSGARLPTRRRNMLLGILDLENGTVDDVMVQRGDIVGIDIDDGMDEILRILQTTQHTRLPVYRGNINNVLGVLHMRNALRFLARPDRTHAALLEVTREPYFVPQGTRLHTQLANFQKEQRRTAMIVDEYGDVVGMLALEDILEEVVGQFTTDFAATMPEVHPQADGSHIIDGRAVLREVNQKLGWSLPTDGPRTLNGLILEHLESIPEANVCLRIGGYRIETLAIIENGVRSARVTVDDTGAADG